MERTVGGVLSRKRANSTFFNSLGRDTDVGLFPGRAFYNDIRECLNQPIARLAWRIGCHHDVDNVA